MSKKAEHERGQALSLPKNIQQIGSTDNGIKVYLEDYSGTYLRRILLEDQKKHGILLGKKEAAEKQTYLFVQAVVTVDIEPRDKYWKYNWNHIYELMQSYFIEEGQEKPEILGWAMSVENYSELSDDELEKMHKCNFDGNMTLAFIMDIQDGKDQFYILENNKFHSLGGYYIYYEKNKNMQTYVLENQPGPCVETEDNVKGNSESYRTILMRRKEMMQRKQTVSLLYVASTFLVMVVVVLGITMMNNYEKMQNMQDILNELSKSVINEEADQEANRNLSVTQPATTPAFTEIPATEDAVMAMSQTIVESSQAAVTSEEVQETTEQPEETDEPEETPEPTSEPEEADDSDDEASQEDDSEETGSTRRRYEIQAGDTLSEISWKMYNTGLMVDKICEYNDIEDDDQIVAGDVLILP